MASSQVTSTSALNATTTTSVVSSQITNPAFFGYTSGSLIGGTTVYVSENCRSSSTFFTSSDYVACCSGSCTPFTGCLSASTLIGPSTTEVCSPYSTCKTDIVFPTQGAVGSLAIYCGEGADVYWYRQLPPDGVDSSNINSINTAQNSNHGPLSLPVGAGVGGTIFLLLVAGILYCLCCGGCLGGRRGGFSGGSTRYHPDQHTSDAAERDWQRQQREDEERWRRQEDDDRRRQQQADQDAQARYN